MAGRTRRPNWGVGIGVGIAVGVSIAVSLDNFAYMPIGIVIGIALSYAFGKPESDD